MNSIVDELKVLISANITKLKAGLNEAKADITSFGKHSKQTTMEVNEAFNKITLEKLRLQYEEQKRALEDLRLELKQTTKDYKKWVDDTYRPYQLAVQAFGGAKNLVQADPSVSGYTKEDLIDIATAYAEWHKKMNAIKSDMVDANEAVVAARRNYEDAKNSAKMLSLTTEKLKEKTNQFSKALNGIVNVAKRMLLRKVFNLIFKDFAEMFKLLMQFDDQLDGSLGYNKAFSDLRSQFKQLSANLAAVTAELLTGLAPALTWILELVNGIARHFSALVAMLSGQTTYTVANPEYWSDYAKELNAAAKAQKNLIGGFDELNVYTSSSQSSINAGDMYETKELGTVAKALAEFNGTTAGSIVKIAGLAAGYWALRKAVKAIANAFSNKNTLLKKQNGLESEASAELSSSLVPALAAGAAGVTALAYGLSKLPESLPKLEPQVNWQPATDSLQAFKEKLQTIGNIVFSPTVGFAFVSAGIATIISMLKEAEWPSIKPQIDFQPVRDFISNLKETFKNLELPSPRLNFNVEPVMVAIAALLAAWNVYSDEVKQRLSNQALEIGSSMQNSFNYIKSSISSWATQTADVVKNWCTNTSYNIKQATSSWAKNAYSSLSNFGTNVSSFIKSTSTGFSNWCKNTSNNIKNWASNVASNMGNTLSNAWQSFKSFMQATGQSISGWWQNNKKQILTSAAIAAGVTAAVVLAPYTGGASLAFAGLANGGVINKPTAAIIGEGKNAYSNPEIVTPENKMREIVEDNNDVLISGFAQMTKQIISAINNVDMSVSIGDDVIAKSASRGNNAYKRITGVALI